MSKTPRAAPLDRLLIVSHVIHYAWHGQLYAYAPYAREIDIWADLFPRIVIAAPCREEEPPADATAFSRPNIEIERQIEAGGDEWSAKFRQLALVPLMAWSLGRAMARADAIHVRCPGNLGLLGAFLAPMFATRLVAKYAAQWPPFPEERITQRLQKAVLRSRWWRGPVTVYGTWPQQGPNIVPFFTSVLSQSDMERARRATVHRTTGNTLHLLYVGRLSSWKRVDALISAIARLRRLGLEVDCDIVGEGPERGALEREVDALGLRPVVRFAGGVGPETVLEFYERADVLVLVSESEGWPKAIAEGMAFGLVCVGSNRGLVPHMLGDGRGFVAPPGDIEMLTAILHRIARAPDEWREMRARAAAWGQRYSVEDLSAALADLLTNAWGVTIPRRPTVAHGQNVAYS